MKENTPAQWQADAREFGLHIRQGGWRLGLLVARNVEKGTGNGGDRKSEGWDQRNDRNADRKVSASAFGEASGTSAPRVLRYLAAWEKAAIAGVVPHPGDLDPGTEPVLNVETLPDWSDFYDATAGVNRIQDTERGRAIRDEAAKAGVSVHKTDEVARNPKAMAAAIMADPAVARAAQAALEAREVTRPKAPPMPRAEEDPQEVADEARYQQLMANRADLMRANTNIREVLRRGVHEDDRPVIASDAAGIRQALEALEALVSGQSIDQEFLDLLNEGR